MSEKKAEFDSVQRGRISGALAGAGAGLAARRGILGTAGMALAGGVLGGEYGRKQEQQAEQLQRAQEAQKKYESERAHATVMRDAIAISRERRQNLMARARLDAMRSKLAAKSRLLELLAKRRGLTQAADTAADVAKATESVAPAVKAVEEVAEKVPLWKQLQSGGKARALKGRHTQKSIAEVSREGVGSTGARLEAITGIIKNQSAKGSLTGLAAELYEQGLVRPEIMKHAVDQAAHVKALGELEQNLKTAALRREFFGASSPTLEKIAVNLPGSVGDLGMVAAGAAAALAGGHLMGAGINLGHRAVDWVMNTEERATEASYQQMMDANPDFRQKQDVVRRHFDVLKSFAPSVAANPTAAAGHVRQAIEMGNMIPVDTIKNLVQTEKLHQEVGSAKYKFPGSK